VKTDDEKLVERRIKEHMPKRYKQYWHCCTMKKGYSGTAILTKVEPIRVQYELGIPELDQEGRSLTIEFNNFIIIAVYAPNSKPDLSRLHERVEKWDHEIRKHIC
jgi:exodeoxyribonuclease III